MVEDKGKQSVQETNQSRETITHYDCLPVSGFEPALNTANGPFAW